MANKKGFAVALITAVGLSVFFYDFDATAKGVAKKEVKKIILPAPVAKTVISDCSRSKGPCVHLEKGRFQDGKMEIIPSHKNYGIVDDKKQFLIQMLKVNGDKLEVVQDRQLKSLIGPELFNIKDDGDYRYQIAMLLNGINYKSDYRGIVVKNGKDVTPSPAPTASFIPVITPSPVPTAISTPSSVSTITPTSGITPNLNFVVQNTISFNFLDITSSKGLVSNLQFGGQLNAGAIEGAVLLGPVYNSGLVGGDLQVQSRVNLKYFQLEHYSSYQMFSSYATYAHWGRVSMGYPIEWNEYTLYPFFGYQALVIPLEGTIGLTSGLGIGLRMDGKHLYGSIAMGLYTLGTIDGPTGTYGLNSQLGYRF